MKLEDLKRSIDRHDYLYYYSEPEITDAEYDALKTQLQELDPSAPQLQRVGAPIEFSPLTTAKHKMPMGSLSNANNEEEFRDWYDKRNAQALWMSYKMDGSSIELLYEEGRLTQAITRGNGIEGEDITHNAVKFVPLVLNESFTGSVRGEAYLKLSDFNQHFQGKANARNAANGTVRRKSGQNAEHLSFAAFNIVNGKAWPTEQEKFGYLLVLGFDIAPGQLVLNADEALEYYNETVTKRDQLDFEIDGVVAKLNELSDQTKWETDRKRPKYAIAFKFKAMGNTSVMHDVSWTVGHTGQVVPTAHVEPVSIGGTTIRNIFLNNPDEIRRLGVQLGDEVEIIRAGDCIPKITGLGKAGNSRRGIPIPEHCPSCASNLVKPGAHLECKNECCPAQVFRKIRVWIEKLDIKYIGDKLREKLWTAGLISRPVDLYKLDHGSLSAHSGDKMAAKILTEIEKARKLPLRLFVGALGIPFLGRRKAEIMIKNGVNTLDKFRDKIWERQPIESVGPGISTALSKGFDDLSEMIDELLEYVEIVEEEKEEIVPVSDGLDNKSFCFTGKILRMDKDGKRFTRQMMWNLVTQNGGQVAKKVDASTDFLVMADPDSTSSKAKKARSMGVTLLAESDFFEMVL